MAKDVTVDLNGSSPNSIADLIVSPFLNPNATISGADGQITSIHLTISGADPAGASLSLASTAPAGFTVSEVGGTWYLTGPTGAAPSNADWAKALDALEGDSPAASGRFRVTVQAFDGTRAVSPKAHDQVIICFAAGTEIATPRGQRRVEDLRDGDEVTTVEGEIVPIRWIGRQTVSRKFADPLRTLPIRVRANALSEGVPSRDLLVSPDHALLVDGALIHASALVNDVSIVREHSAPETFVYYHVELADHSLILAENAPAETFLDNVDRLAFDNWAEHQALVGAGAPIVEMRYPRAKSARQVPQATRARLAARSLAIYPRERDVA
jgi:hypothetical protein